MTTNIYILQLEQGKYYVGKASDVLKRYKDHQNGTGAAWTSLYKPISIINVITGAKDPLVKVLAEHDDVDGIWYFGTAAGVKAVELAAAANMKRTWAFAHSRDWSDVRQGEGREFLRHASEVKNIWIPYGE